MAVVGDEMNDAVVSNPESVDSFWTTHRGHRRRLAHCLHVWRAIHLHISSQIAERTVGREGTGTEGLDGGTQGDRHPQRATQRERERVEERERERERERVAVSAAKLRV